MTHSSSLNDGARPAGTPPREPPRRRLEERTRERPRRQGLLEVMRDPDPATAVYRDLRSHRAGDRIELAAVPGVQVAVADLIPPRR